ncbi:monocarboxylate transporter [Holotrichia oblita]|uniref:Monocarboxylate transporter n=2 Tax=Holotrichia oblita TaxID=644536 RepID=A0ACB9SUA3_HOLOL|nr:monocarboxylate transporter [Holotrichia oblita]KAI4458331.1 monocarboxylate transporter [Holotrichia oblita]
MGGAEQNIYDNQNPSVSTISWKNQNGTSLEKKNLQENQIPMTISYVAPDGGSRAWLVLFCAFLCNGVIWGIINSYSVLQHEFYQNLAAKNDTQASSKAALVGSLAISATFMMSAVAGILTNLIGLRTTAFVGGALSCGGMLLSSFFTDNIAVLYFTYGIMCGIGCALVYTPSLAILGHYFKKYIGVANGIVASGSSVFTMVMPYVMGFFLNVAYLHGTLKLLAAILVSLMCCALVFKPLVKTPTDKKVTVMQASNFMSLWKNKKYCLWAFLISISLFGYFVPYVHMSMFVEKHFVKGTDAKLPILCIGITSGLGRLIFGYIADKPKVDRILLQQVSFLVIGTLTMLLPSTSSCYECLIAITLGMGLFDGCFISLLGPIAFDICGHECATQAIGFLLGLCSIPLTTGPYVAGLLFDSVGNYDLALRLAGIPPIIGGIAMFSIRCIATKDLRNNRDIKEDDRGNKEKLLSSGKLLVDCKYKSIALVSNGASKRSYDYTIL